MKRAVCLLIIFIFAVNAPAQTDSAAAPSPTPATPVKTEEKPQNGNAAQGKFNLPPEKSNPVKIPRFETSPVIDGKLDESAWQTAAQFKDFYQTSPGDNVAPSKPTVAYMGYDAEHLYLAFYCWDDPEKIRATVAKRDEVFGEDNVRVWLDTYNDQRRAYVFGFNPLGVQQDGIFTEGQGADFSVDVVMESKGVILPDGWSVEVKIPFKSMRYEIGKGKLWGFNAARNIDRFNDEFDQWLPDDRNVSGFLVKHGKITGIEDIKVERVLEIVPSITVSESGNRTRTVPLSSSFIDPGRFVNGGVKQDIGVNVKFNFTPNITFDLAYNPDFAEIEADAPVVTANQRFPIFFQEKRPFFLEGSEIFQAPLALFYTRTIIDPDIAVKLSGKSGKNSFGLLVASDNAPGNYSEDERTDPIVSGRISEFVDKNALIGVVRLKRDVGKENHVGFFGTARTFPEQRNFVGGFDGRFKLSPRLVSQFHVLGTHSRQCFREPNFEPALEPEQARRNREICGGSTFRNYRTGNGAAYLFNLDYTAKNYGYFFELVGRTKDYRADVGFTRRVNNSRAQLAGRLSTEPNPKGKIIRFDWRPSIEFAHDFKGRATDAGFESDFNFSLQRNTFVFIEAGAFYERIFEEEFGLRRAPSRPDTGAFFGAPERSGWQYAVSGGVNTTFNKRLSAELFLGRIQNATDFDFGNGAGCGFDTRFPRVSPNYVLYANNCRPDPLADEPARDPGAGRQYDIGVELNYKPVDPLNISFRYNKSNLVRDDNGLTAFDSNIFTVRTTYQFTRFAFVRSRVDYSSLDSNASGQLLFGYTPNPGTAFYVGYNDNFNYNGFSPFTGQFEPRFERNSRTFFVRASYLFRKSF